MIKKLTTFLISSILNSIIGSSGSSTVTDKIMCQTSHLYLINYNINIEFHYQYIKKTFLEFFEISELWGTQSKQESHWICERSELVCLKNKGQLLKQS